MVVYAAFRRFLLNIYETMGFTLLALHMCFHFSIAVEVYPPFSRVMPNLAKVSERNTELNFGPFGNTIRLRKMT